MYDKLLVEVTGKGFYRAENMAMYISLSRKASPADLHDTGNRVKRQKLLFRV
jgi:hypothetical protein